MSEFEHMISGVAFAASPTESGTRGSSDYRRSRGAQIPTGAWEPTHDAHEQPNVGDSERLISAAAGLGLAAIGLARGRLPGLALTAMGAGLLWRGITGRCQCYAALGISTAEHNQATAVSAKRGCKVEKTLTINRPPSELYKFWRSLENLPTVMRHLKSVEPLDQQRSHWRAEGVFGKSVEWDAEIINERENEIIAWRSLPGGDIDTAGSVHFKPLPDGRGTEVTVSMKYNSPAGKLGEYVASYFGDGLHEKLDEDLQRFKHTMEAAAVSSPTPGVRH